MSSNEPDGLSPNTMAKAIQLLGILHTQMGEISERMIGGLESMHERVSALESAQVSTPDVSIALGIPELLERVQTLEQAQKTSDSVQNLSATLDLELERVYEKMRVMQVEFDAKVTAIRREIRESRN